MSASVSALAMLAVDHDGIHEGAGSERNQRGNEQQKDSHG
jgi:hypothetical protein